MAAVSSTNAAAACRDAVAFYAQLLDKRAAGTISMAASLEAWTNYVISTDHGTAPEVADVLSTLFNCLRMSNVEPSSNEQSPLGSSSALHGVDEQPIEVTVSPRGGLLGNRLPKRRSVSGQLAAASLSPGSSTSAPKAPPPDDLSHSGTVNPRRTSFREVRETRDSLVRAPEQESLGGGLEEGDCVGFKLE